LAKELGREQDHCPPWALKPGKERRDHRLGMNPPLLELRVRCQLLLSPLCFKGIE
jgi:hypothetical protein